MHFFVHPQRLNQLDLQCMLNSDQNWRLTVAQTTEVTNNSRRYYSFLYNHIIEQLVEYLDDIEASDGPTGLAQ